MPRMKPPRGYVSLREAQRMLNLSSAMIRRYVDQGRIGYLLPPGRHHGFYRRRDIEQLAAELAAFLNLEEEEEPINFRPARIEDLPSCIQLNRQLFPDALRQADDAVLIQKWNLWMSKNPEIVHILEKGRELIGILTMLPFPPSSARLMDALRGDTSLILGNNIIEAHDLEQYTPGNRIDLYLMEIGIRPDLPISQRRRYGARLIGRCIDFIVDLGRRGIFIDRLIAIGQTKAGRRLLQHFGFYEVDFERKDTRLFILRVAESGAPLIRSYRQALREWQAHQSSLPASHPSAGEGSNP